MTQRSTRRTYLSALGPAGAAVLAGCADDGPATATAGGSSPDSGTGTPTAGQETGTAPRAEFTFDYADDNQLLLVTHSGGDSLPPGEIIVTGPGETVTWAELTDRDATEQVDQGDIAQLGAGNAYDRPVASDDAITLYYTGGDEREQLAQWRGS